MVEEDDMVMIINGDRVNLGAEMVNIYRNISMGANHLQKGILRTVANKLKINKNLHYFFLTSHRLTKELVEIIGEIIKDHDELTCLMLKEANIAAKDFQLYLEKVLVNNPALFNMAFTNCQLGDDCIQKFLGALESKANLTALTLENCGLTDASISYFIDFMKSHPVFINLNISENSKITEKGIDLLLEGLKGITTLQHLNITGTKMTNKSMPKFMEVLKYHNTTIKSITRNPNLCTEEEELCINALFAAAGSKPCNRKIKEYECLRTLGKGCFGTTFLAFKGNKPMALKELVLPTPEAIAETEHEVQLMKLLNHPFLVRMFDSFAIDTYYYILMEVAQAGDMNNVLDPNKALNFPTEKQYQGTIYLRWMREICDGVYNMHKSHVVHLDLKPANVFLSSKELRETHMKIGDFGISNRVGQKNYVMTEFGTPEYVAPEIWEGVQFRYEPDVFALGVIFHEIALRKKPFICENDVELLADQIINEPFDPTELKKLEYMNIADLTDRMLYEINKLYFKALQEHGENNEITRETISTLMGDNPDQCAMIVPIFKIVEEWDNNYGRIFIDPTKSGVSKTYLHKHLLTDEFDDNVMSYINIILLRNHPQIISPNIAWPKPIQLDPDSNSRYFLFQDVKDQISNIIKEKKKNGGEMARTEILLSLIYTTNALQYAFDNGFHHGNLSTSVLFMDHWDRIKVGGFRTSLREHITNERVKTYKDQMYDTLALFPTEELKKDYMVQIETMCAGMSEEELNMVVSVTSELAFPLPQINIENVKEDLRALGNVWIELTLLERPTQDSIDNLIIRMPDLWRPLLLRIFQKGKGITDLHAFRANLHDLIQEEIDPEFLKGIKMIEKKEEVGDDPEEEATRPLPKIGGGGTRTTSKKEEEEEEEEATMVLPKIGGGSTKKKLEKDEVEEEEATMVLPKIGGAQTNQNSKHLVEEIKEEDQTPHEQQFTNGQIQLRLANIFTPI